MTRLLLDKTPGDRVLPMRGHARSQVRNDDVGPGVESDESKERIIASEGHRGDAFLAV